jgi:hypothetical protein
MSLFVCHELLFVHYKKKKKSRTDIFFLWTRSHVTSQIICITTRTGLQVSCMGLPETLFALAFFVDEVAANQEGK